MKFSIEVHKKRAIRLTPNPGGFLDYSFVEGLGTVVECEHVKRKLFTSVRLVTLLVVELRDGVPAGRKVDAAPWITAALYRHGGHVIQFESTTPQGTIEIAGKHLRLELEFAAPRIDDADAKSVTASVDQDVPGL